MNSAPVQLLPVEISSGNKDVSPKNETLPEGRKSFDEVFEKTSAEKQSERPAVKDESSPRKAENRKSKEETAVDGNRKTQKGKSSDADEAVAASVAADVEEHVENLKKGLGFGKQAVNADAVEKKADGEIKESETLKKGFKENRRASAAGKEKSSNNIIELAFPDAVKRVSGKPDEKNGVNELKQISGDSENAGLAEKLKIAASKAGKEQPEAKLNAKPGIELISLSENKDVSGKKKASEKELKSSRANKFRIVDLRTASAESSRSAKSGELKGQSVTGVDTDSSIKFGGQNAQGSQTEAYVKGAASNETRTFQSAVLDQLKDGINSQIVKQAGIVVKGDGTGEIKLVMKPESLGKVRIQLSLNDNHIAGRIIVENNIVREIFESNLENLYKAFGSEGFENGGLEVSVRERGGEQGSNGRRNGRGRDVRAVKAMDEAVPEVSGSEWRNNAVNMVV